MNELQIQCNSHINYFYGESFPANIFNITAIWRQFRKRWNSPLLHYFYCESFVQLLVFDALLLLTWHSGKYQVLLARFLILIVPRVYFPPMPKQKNKQPTNTRENAHENKCKTSHHHRVTSFTFRSQQPPLLLFCLPDPTPRTADTFYVTPPVIPVEAGSCRSTASEAMRQRRPSGKSELSS